MTPSPVQKLRDHAMLRPVTGDRSPTRSHAGDAVREREPPIRVAQNPLHQVTVERGELGRKALHDTWAMRRVRHDRWSSPGSVTDGSGSVNPHPVSTDPPISPVTGTGATGPWTVPITQR